MAERKKFNVLKCKQKYELKGVLQDRNADGGADIITAHILNECVRQPKLYVFVGK